MGRHLLKVEPLNAILDPHYFVRAVHGAVLNVLQARSVALDDRLARMAGNGYGLPYYCVPAPNLCIVFGGADCCSHSMSPATPWHLNGS